MNLLPAETITLLEANDWVVESQFPLEIRHKETDSFATKLAAHHVVSVLQAGLALQLNPATAERLSPASSFSLLKTAVAQSEKYCEAVWNMEPTKRESTDAWRTAYTLVFTNCRSDYVSALLEVMGQHLSWYDPDSSYEEDVTSYVRALREKVLALAPFFD